MVQSAAARADAVSPGRRSATRMVNAREITTALVRRDLVSRYRRTALGLLWSLAPPVFTVATYYFLFVTIAGTSPAPGVVRPDGTTVPVYVWMSTGVVAWTFFATAVGVGARSVIGAGPVLKSLAFPRSALPLTSVLSSLVGFAFEFVVLMALIVVTVGPPNAQILWLPVILLVIAAFSFGIGLILSSLTVFARDLGELITLVLRLWMLGTPVVFSLDLIADQPTLTRAIELNPMTGPIIGFRNVVLMNTAPDFGLLAYSAVFTTAVVAIGWVVFHRWQRLFPELA
jgi:ABC-type polysaccharide/polyol phosphate export permease